MLKHILIIIALTFPLISWAGNPDRQGEAGAYELLLNPWARSAGVGLLNTGTISGVEAMRLNPAGLYFEGKSEFSASHMRLFDGAGVNMNAAGMAFKIGDNGTMGFNLGAMDFGDNAITTVLQPEGTGGTFSPSFIHVGVGYSHSFKDKIFVGVLFRGISETVVDVSALGVAMDAGVQYRGGKDNRVRLGISLRNMGPPMKFSGEGLSNEISVNEPQTNQYFLTGYVRASKFELPTVLNLGTSYDFQFAGGRDYLRTMVNFTSNAFSRDNLGVGAEYSFRKFLQLRAGYRIALGEVAEGRDDLYTGISGGFSIDVKTSKKPENKNRLGIDYSYRTNQHFAGTHNLGLRYTIQ